MWEFLGGILAALFTPIAGEGVLAYRVRALQNIIIILLVVGFCLDVGLACGHLKFIFPGFATVDMVEKDTLLLGTIRDQEIIRDMKAANEKTCIALHNNNSEAASTASDDLSNIRNNWAQFHQQPFQLPTCHELGY